MKKRDQKPVIIGFILALILFFGFSLIIIYYIYPKLIQIENLKGKYANSLVEINKLEYNGLDYNTYISLKNIYNLDKSKNIFDESYKNMIKNLDENFYNETLSGSIKSNILFLKSLDNINKNILLKKNSEVYKKQIEDISNILPKYSEYSNSNKFLSNFKFINYVEQLLNKYNITTDNEIGVKNIILEKNTDNIYYIPITLDITGTKGNIIKFLNNIKDSGDIIFKDGNIKIINGREQLAEVDSILLKDYINISNKNRYKTESLYSFLSRTNQIDDDIKAKIIIKFYVNGVGKDTILKDINKVIGNIKSELLFDKNGNIKKDKSGKNIYKLVNYNYSNLLFIAKKIRSNTIINKNNYLKSKVSKIYNYLNDTSLKKDIKNIKKEIIKAKDLNSIYKKVLKYKEIFSSLDRELYDIVKTSKLEKILPKNYYPQN